MRRSKPLVLTALVLALVQTVGCSSFQALTGPLPTQRPTVMKDRKPIIRVSTVDGRSEILQSAWQDSVSVGGFTRGDWPKPVAIPRSEVQKIEISRPDEGKTVVSLAIGAALIGFLVHELATMELDLDFSRAWRS